MRYHVVHDGSTIGESELEHHDHRTGVRWGAFTPHKDYDSVREVFFLFTTPDDEHPPEAEDSLLNRYYEARDALALMVLDTETGEQIPGQVHIVDFPGAEESIEMTLFPVETGDPE